MLGKIEFWYKQEGNLVTILEKAQPLDTDFLFPSTLTKPRAHYSTSDAQLMIFGSTWTSCCHTTLCVFPHSQGDKNLYYLCLSSIFFIHTGAHRSRRRPGRQKWEIQPSSQTRLTVDLQKIYTKKRAKIDVSWWCPSSSKTESSTPWACCLWVWWDTHPYPLAGTLLHPMTLHVRSTPQLVCANPSLLLLFVWPLLHHIHPFWASEQQRHRHHQKSLTIQ